VSVWLVAAAAAQTVEFPDRPTGSLRTRSVGGARTGLAEGTACVPGNPAAVAIRRQMAPEDRQELASSIQLAAHPWITAGLELLHDDLVPPLPRVRSRWRVGLAGRRDRSGVTLAVAEHSMDEADGRWVSRTWTLGAGRAGPTWAVGLTADVLQFRRDVEGREGAVGGGASVGALWAPHREPWRLGARVTTPIRTGALSDGSRLRTPFEAVIGASATWGAVNVARDLGPGRATRRASGEYLLVDVDLVVTGGGGDAVALLPLLEEGRRSRVGGPTVAVRGGAEVALWRDRLRVRVGLASVPARGGAGGLRVGAGAALRLVEAHGVSYRVAGYVGAGPLGWTGGVGGDTW